MKHKAPPKSRVLGDGYITLLLVLGILGLVLAVFAGCSSPDVVGNGWPIVPWGDPAPKAQPAKFATTAPAGSVLYVLMLDSTGAIVAPTTATAFATLNNLYRMSNPSNFVTQLKLTNTFLTPGMTNRYDKAYGWGNHSTNSYQVPYNGYTMHTLFSLVTNLYYTLYGGFDNVPLTDSVYSKLETRVAAIESKTGSAVWADAQYPNALLLSGARKMKGNIDLNGTNTVENARSVEFQDPVYQGTAPTGTFYTSYAMFQKVEGFYPKVGGNPYNASSVWMTAESPVMYLYWGELLGTWVIAPEIVANPDNLTTVLMSPGGLLNTYTPLDSPAWTGSVTVAAWGSGSQRMDATDAQTARTVDGHLANVSNDLAWVSNLVVDVMGATGSAVWAAEQYPLALLTNGLRPMGTNLNMGTNFDITALRRINGGTYTNFTLARRVGVPHLMTNMYYNADVPRTSVWYFSENGVVTNWGTLP